MPSADRTVIAALPRSVLGFCEALGMPAPALARAAGLADADLADPDGRVPVDAYAALWRALAGDPRAEGLLPMVAGLRDVAVLGVVGYVLAHSPTIAVAFSAYERHRRVIGDFVGFALRADTDRFALEFTIPPEFREVPLFAESTLVLNHTLLRLLAARTATPVVSRLPHARAAGSALLQALLGGRVEYQAPTTALVYPPEVATLPVARADPGLFLFVERHAIAVRERLGGKESWAQRVRDQVLGRVHGGEPTQAAVARALAVSERTLQRRLGEEDTTFQQILDECRRDLALRYIEDPALSLGEVAFLLGYSEPSAFHRAFRRWTGRTPTEARQLARAS